MTSWLGLERPKLEDPTIFTQAAEMVYTSTQWLKILNGSTQTDMKSSQINRLRVQAFHIIPIGEFYSGWFLNLHHNSSLLFKMMLFHFAWQVQCVPVISVQCHVELSCLLPCLLDLNIKLRWLHHAYLLHIAIVMMRPTFLITKQQYLLIPQENCHIGNIMSSSNSCS